MARILAVYGTSNGQTARITKQLVRRWRARQFEVDVYTGRRLSLEATLEPFDAVVVGASVHWGRHQPYIEDFVRDHRAFLADMPSAFFSVSGAMAGDGSESRRAARGYVEDFRRRTGWEPDLTRCFAGSMAYSQYNRIQRTVMQIIARVIEREEEEPTRDREYTDWERVDDFAVRFAGHVRDLVGDTPARVAE